MTTLVAKLEALLSKVIGTKAAGSVETFVLTESAKAIAVLKTTHIGAAVAQAISDVEDATLSPVEKLEKVIADTSPLFVTYLLNKGQRDIDAASVYSTVKALAQEVFLDVKSTSAGAIAAAVLKAL